MNCLTAFPDSRLDILIGTGIAMDPLNKLHRYHAVHAYSDVEDQATHVIFEDGAHAIIAPGMRLFWLIHHGETI